MRIAITGSKGQLGRALQEILKGEPLFLIDLPEHDFTSLPIIKAIAGFSPEVVIHGGAHTDVERCARDPDTAYLVNALGTQNVALACQRCDAAMVYISTNEVFNGSKNEPYLEFDRPDPINAYGRSKLAGELFTQALLNRFYIVRTSWLYARGGENFVTKIIRAADERGRLRVVTDEVSSPTYAPDLAEAIANLIRTEHYGIYHLINEGVCSRYDFAVKILALSGRGHIPIEPVTLAEYKRASTPPPYAPLRNFCAAVLGIKLRPWEEALRAYFEE
ncbi:MAG: dTDP-4-dehydrorhamnose reductase [Chloroflexota bacterium]|nr:dTDP-4-dehydrorhamnose reductase [Chloroflexota bacterium]